MVYLSVKVVPNSSKTMVVGWADEAKTVLTVKLAAPPVDGSANTALIKFLAQQLSVAKSRAVIKRGKSSRHKVVALDISEQELAKWLKTFN